MRFTNTRSQKLREGEKKTGSLASEFQFYETACSFIHQTRMYGAVLIPIIDPA